MATKIKSKSTKKTKTKQNNSNIALKAQIEPVINHKVLKDTKGSSISLLSPDLKIIWANRYLEKIHGKLKDLEGKYCYEIYHGIKSPCKDCIPLRSIESKAIETGVIKRRTKNGSSRYLQSVSVPFVDEKGNVHRILEIMFDVTKDKLLDEDIKKSEKFYRTLFEHSGTAIAINDKKGILTSVNKAFSDLAGFPKEEIEGKKHYLEFVVDKDRVNEIHKQRWSGGGVPPTKYDFIFLTKNKDQRMIDISINKIPETELSLASMIDITEKKELEMEISEAEQFLANILQESADAIIVTDNDGVIRTWNKGAEDIFGYSEKNVLGKNIDLITPSDLVEQKEIEELKKRCLNEGHVRNFITERVRKNKRRINVAQTLTSVKDALGKAVAIAWIIRDITERKRIEQELIQTDKMKSIGQLSASLAHEIKNPLNSIVINLEILRSFIDKNTSDELKKPFDKYIGIIQTEVTRLDKVIKDFLNFAKPQTTLYEDVDVNDIISHIVEFLEPETNKNGVTIYKKLSKKLYKIHGEENQLKQIILNLLLNSVQAMPEGGTVTISTDNAKDGKVLISIHDTGIGISTEDASQIFDPFFTTKEKGSGLGLPMVGQLIKNHGGKIRFESVQDKGTTFYIHFPTI